MSTSPPSPLLAGTVAEPSGARADRTRRWQLPLGSLGRFGAAVLLVLLIFSFAAPPQPAIGSPGDQAPVGVAAAQLPDGLVVTPTVAQPSCSAF